MYPFENSSFNIILILSGVLVFFIANFNIESADASSLLFLIASSKFKSLFTTSITVFASKFFNNEEVVVNRLLLKPASDKTVLLLSIKVTISSLEITLESSS